MPSHLSTMDYPSSAQNINGADAPHRLSVEVAGLTDRGKGRENNEDAFLVARLMKSMKVCASSLPGNGSRLLSEEEGYLFVVADGMGGAVAGEKASATAVASVEEFTLNTFKWFLHLGGPEEQVLKNELRAALETADRAVIERAQSDPKLRGMGTTLTMAYAIGSDLFIVHAGDTRAYLHHEGGLQQLTNDHTLAQILVDHGSLSADDAKHHKGRNVVTNVVGGPKPGVEAEIHKLRVAPGDQLLLCSDGLTLTVPDDLIAQTLAESDHPEDACLRLINLAARKRCAG